MASEYRDPTGPTAKDRSESIALQPHRHTVDKLACVDYSRRPAYVLIKSKYLCFGRKKQIKYCETCPRTSKSSRVTTANFKFFIYKKRNIYQIAQLVRITARTCSSTYTQRLTPDSQSTPIQPASASHVIIVPGPQRPTAPVSHARRKMQF